jgi:hypothetical protein
LLFDDLLALLLQQEALLVFRQRLRMTSDWPLRPSLSTWRLRNRIELVRRQAMQDL